MPGLALSATKGRALAHQMLDARESFVTKAVIAEGYMRTREGRWFPAVEGDTVEEAARRRWNTQYDLLADVIDKYRLRPQDSECWVGSPEAEQEPA